ncbi:MAG TPA: cation:proton antiporter [Candidatus Saccharimonadales bacterium]|nr:cation:proton antiporter [Candidatus Saccharimonadales bacterium]
MEQGLVIDVALCIIAAWVVAVISQVTRQPLLLAYLVAGFAIGPHGFKWVTNPTSIETISGIGLSLLLFMIGLEIDLKKMVSAGRVITITAVCQILGCIALGWLFFGFLGPAKTWLEAFYLGVASAMSSTVIIVKILYDKRELETLAGRITLGVLVLQDIATILFLAIQPNLKNPAVSLLAVALGKVLLLVAVAYIASRFLLPPVFKFVARLPELVLVGALAWCFALAGFADNLGLSSEMGALIAGVMISTFPYALDVVAKVTSIRDFFVTLFFVGLGMTIPMPTWNYLIWMMIFSMVIVGGRLLTVFTPLYLMKQGYRMSLLPAINLSQMSELSLVLLALGKASGDVSDTSSGICAFVFSFLAVDTTYAILKNDYILQKTVPWLNWFGLRDLAEISPESKGAEHFKRICLLGFSWTASSLLEEIRREKPALLRDILVVDFNPHVYERLRHRGVQVVYGDITQRNVLQHAGVTYAEIIVCSLPNTLLKGANNLKLLRQLRELNPRAQIIVHAEQLHDIPTLYTAGANYVSAPRLLEASDLLRAIDAADQNLLNDKRGEQTEQLEERNEVIP